MLCCFQLLTEYSKIKNLIMNLPKTELHWILQIRDSSLVFQLSSLLVKCLDVYHHICMPG